MPLLLIAFTASAATYEADFAVPPTPPPSVYGNDVEHASMRIFPDVASGHPDQQVASTWSYATCQVHDGDIEVVFRATSANWPTSIPATFQCSSQGETLVLHTITDNAAYNTFATSRPGPLVPSIGLEIVHALGGASSTPRALPTSHTYVTGKSTAYRGNAPWPGVWCDVREASGGGHYVVLTTGNAAQPDDGYCIIETSAGLNHHLPVSIEGVDIVW